MSRKPVEHMPPEYECRVCHTVKPIEEFYKMPNSKRGHHTRCKECTREYTAANAEKNRERTRVWNEQFRKKLEEMSPEERAAHREKEAARQRDYYHRNREQCLEARKRYYKQHTEKMLEASRQYYEDHKEEISKRNKERYYKKKEENPEWYAERLQKTREYYEAHKERYNANRMKKYYEEKAKNEENSNDNDDTKS